MSEIDMFFGKINKCIHEVNIIMWIIIYLWLSIEFIVNLIAIVVFVYNNSLLDRGFWVGSNLRGITYLCFTGG